MNRVLEPEVMADPRQALAYARADFADVNQRFVDGLVSRHPALARARVIDLGCGPADIPLRLAAALPDARVVAIDASPAMLALGREAVRGRRLRVGLVGARLPRLPFADRGFDAVISNSLLHHLPEPATFWSEVRRLLSPGGVVHGSVPPGLGGRSARDRGGSRRRRGSDSEGRLLQLTAGGVHAGRGARAAHRRRTRTPRVRRRQRTPRPGDRASLIGGQPAGASAGARLVAALETNE